MKFTKVFADLVKSSNLTQTEIAKGIGVTQQTISSYKHGRITPDLETLIKIAEFFNVSMDYLLTGVRAENKSVQEILKLSDKAIENLKFLAENTEFFDELLSDKEFKETLYYAIHLFLSNIVILLSNTSPLNKEIENNHTYYVNIYHREMDVVLDEDFSDKWEKHQLNMLEYLERDSADSIARYFENFFKKINFVRNNKPIPPSIKKEFRKLGIKISEKNFPFYRK